MRHSKLITIAVVALTTCTLLLGGCKQKVTEVTESSLPSSNDNIAVDSSASGQLVINEQTSADETDSLAADNTEAPSSDSTTQQGTTDSSSIVSESVDTSSSDTTPVESSIPPTQVTNNDQTNSPDAGSAIASTALSNKGSQFKQNGTNPETGFDNSGFIWYVLNQNGIDAPRKLSGQKDLGTAVSWEDMQPGDIVIFGESDSGQFAGVITDKGKMIYAANAEKNVAEVDITTPYWQKNFVTARRLG